MLVKAVVCNTLGVTDAVRSLLINYLYEKKKYRLIPKLFSKPNIEFESLLPI